MRSSKRIRAGLTALHDGDTCSEAIRSAARLYVRDGESLETFLEDLEAAHDALGLPPASTEMVKEASIAWADESLAVFDGEAFEDPLTGLATPGYARSRLRALYRTRPGRPDTTVPGAHAVIIVTLIESDPGSTQKLPIDAAFDQSLRLATVAETIRATFDRCEVVTALGNGRTLAVVARDQYLTNRIDELSWLLRRRLPVRCAPRVLAESLPETETDAYLMLDELSS